MQPRRIAQLKDVARGALDREVLIERADDRVVRIEDDAIIGDLGDGAARRLGEQPRATASANGGVDLVAVHQGRAAAAAGGKALGRHLQHAVERRAIEVAIGPRARHQREEIVFRAVAACGLGDDLLRQHVERRVVRDDGVEQAGPDRAQERRAFHEIVARHREHPALRGSGNRVARAPDALQQRGDPVRRSNLAHQVDMADVDAELQRRGGDERPQLSGLQPRFGVEPLLLRQAAMMRRHGVVAEPFAEVPREPLRHAPCVHEDQRRPMGGDERRQAVVVFLPDLVRHHGVERGARHLDAEVHSAPVADVDDGAAGGVAGGEESGDLLDRASASPTARYAAGACSATAASRSSVNARCAPRREPMTAWISSTITVRTVRSICRLRSDVRSRYSDSGVVTRMCGGVRNIAARSACVVSPVRTAAVIRGARSPASSARR